MWKAALLCLCVITSFRSVAGNPFELKGSSILIKDSTFKLTNDINREARKATLMSAILPGLGQIYNRKYWKVPVIYAAAGGLGYFFVVNNKQYKNYQQALTYRFDDDVSTEDAYPQYDDANLVVLKKKYKKRRDLCGIGVGAVYLLNIIDANVDAHLRGFDEKINEKLSLSIKPCANVLTTFQQPVYYSGLKIKLRF